MQPNNPNSAPAPPSAGPPTPPPTTDNVAPVGPVLVENVPIVQQTAAPAPAAPATPSPTPPSAAPAAKQPQPAHQVKPQPVAKPGKHKTSDPKPWLVIFLALVIAIVLAAFALKAYKS